MKKKWKLLTILCAIVLSMCALMTACDDGGKGKISFETASITVEMGETKTLTVIKENIEKELVFTSSNTDVVTITTSGEITAVGVGSSTITVKVSKKLSATCEVTVIPSSNIPVINFDHENNLNVILESSFNIVAKVKFKGKVVETPIKYTADASETVSVSDTGLISALKVGVGKIAVTANYMGHTCQEEITVNVVYDMKTAFYVNDILAADNALELMYETSAIVTTKSYYKETLITAPSIAWEADINKAEVVGENAQATITPKCVGEIKVVATLTYEAKVIKTTLTITAKPLEKNIETEIYLDKDFLEDGAIDWALPAEVSAEKVISIEDYDSETAVDFEQTTAEDNSLSLFVISLNVGERIFLVTTDTAIFTFTNIITATKTISDVDSFTAFAEAYHTGNANGATIGWFVVMTANVDLASVDAVALGFQKGHFWNGTFDGRGHSLSNLQTQNGLFAVLTGTAVVKNLAIINAVMQDNGGIIANEAYGGTVENCFVKFRRPVGATKNCNAAIINAMYNPAIIKNCIVDIESSVTTKAIANLFQNAGPSVVDSYAISSTAKYAYVTETAGLYKTAKEFGAEFEGFVADKNWGKQWKIENEKVFFGDNLVIDLREEVKDISITYDGKAFPENANTAEIFDLTKLSAASVTNPTATYSWFVSFNNGAEAVLDITNTAMKFTEKGLYTITARIDIAGYHGASSIELAVDDRKIQDKTAEAEIANLEVRAAGNMAIDLTGKLTNETLQDIKFASGETLNHTLVDNIATITRENLTKRGKQVIILGTDKNIYKYNIWIADFDIKDLASFTAFAEEYKVKGVNPNQTAGMYVMMTANVDLASVDAVALGMAAGRTWRGTFDGRGHSLSNLQTSNGLFATLGGNAVVKNLAIINATMQGNGGIIANEAYNDSTIENCFVKFRRPEGATKDCKGLVNAVQMASVTIKNCIIDIESSVTTKALASSVKPGATIVNSYAVSSTATYLHSTVTAGLYKTPSAFNTAFEGFVEGKNWSEYWKVEGTNLYFGDNLVMDLTIA